jgi:hypothetical protein
MQTKKNNQNWFGLIYFCIYSYREIAEIKNSKIKFHTFIFSGGNGGSPIK